MPSVTDQLRELTRGIVDLHDVADLEEKLKRGRPLRVKAGFDPTRPDLHLGHTVLMQKMRQFQDLGHQVIFLVGDFTAMIGDPTGKSEQRPRLTKEEVVAAAKTYTDQAFKVLDPSKTEVRYNSEWLDGLNLNDIIALCSKRTVARIIERRDFRERLDENRDVYLHELLYPMVQAYDSVALEADVELGGTDQLFNLMVGRDIMKAYGKAPQIVMTTPILEGLDARVEDGRVVGNKMSKSADNYIGIDEAPLEMYRKAMQIDDTVVWRYYELLSSRSAPEVEAIRERSDPLGAKREFALEIVERFHTRERADAARSEFEASYLKSGVPDDVPELDIPTEGDALLLSKALSASKLVSSTSEGRRLIEQGGVEVDQARIKDPKHTLALGTTYLIRVGSKKRKFCRISVVN